jgi:hypothetical protein
MLGILLVGAAALLLVWFSIDRPMTTVVESEVELAESGESGRRPVPAENSRTDPAMKRADDESSRADSVSTMSQAGVESLPSEFPGDIDSESVSPVRAKETDSKYVVGAFDAPEHLQIAVYRAVNEEHEGYVAFVDNMECDSGDCEINIRIVAPNKLSERVADVFQRINAHLADNPLTSQVMVGIRSMQIDANRDARLALATMPRTLEDPDNPRR